jgi:hypothetical protein
LPSGSFRATSPDIGIIKPAHPSVLAERAAQRVSVLLPLQLRSRIVEMRAMRPYPPHVKSLDRQRLDRMPGKAPAGRSCACPQLCAFRAK